MTSLVEKPAPGKAGIDAFFTAKGDDVFAILPRWPGKQLRLTEGGLKPKAITLLGAASPLKWKIAGATVVVDLPELPDPLLAQPLWVLKISQ